MQEPPKAVSQKTVIRTTFGLVALFLIFVSVMTYRDSFAASSSTDDIQSKIADNNAKIVQLQKDIDNYSSLLDSTSKQAQTLKTALQGLQTTQQKLQANLSLTTAKISKTGLTLQQINKDIADTQTKLASTSAAIAENIRETEEAESQSAVEAFLSDKSISETMDYVNSINSLQADIKGKYEDYKTLAATLAAKKGQAEGQQTQLQSYVKDLSNQKQVAATAADEKNKLLADTQDKQANYASILAEKTTEEKESEAELYDYESQLPATASVGVIPRPTHGILSWPLDNIYVTQYFGSTVDAKRLYTNGSHGGVDFRASIGTPVYAALTGTVAATEPTKFKAGCQYGKFVLLDHPDGLSTIYGHLSLVTVKPGDKVSTGDIIGYSGDTGYATGPHLHFGLYVTSAIEVVDSAQLGSTNCAGIKTVAAPHEDYLDPMAYLPAYSQK